MTLEEYNSSLEKLKENFENAREQLIISYCISQRKFNIGDIISDGSVTIQIERFKNYISIEGPVPVYVGKVLKKDLTPKKNGEIESIYGNKDIKLIKAKV